MFYHLLCVLLFHISKQIAYDCQSLWNVKQKLFMCVENAKNNHFKNKTSKTIDFYDGAASIISVFCYFENPTEQLIPKSWCADDGSISVLLHSIPVLNINNRNLSLLTNWLNECNETRKYASMHCLLAYIMIIFISINLLVDIGCRKIQCAGEACTNAVNFNEGSNW